MSLLIWLYAVAFKSLGHMNYHCQKDKELCVFTWYRKVAGKTKHSNNSNLFQQSFIAVYPVPFFILGAKNNTKVNKA